MSSILSTSCCGEGTQTTSLPDWPTSGLNSAFGVCAKAQTAIAEKTSVASDRLAQCHALIFLLQVVFGKKEIAAASVDPDAARSVPVCSSGTFVAQGRFRPE